MKTTLYIDKNLVLRASEKGWPKPETYGYESGTSHEGWHFSASGRIKYNNYLAQAKADSIPVDGGTIPGSLTHTLMTAEPNTFIDFEGEVDVVNQRRIREIDPWTDGTPPSDAHANKYTYETRKVARLITAVGLSKNLN